MKIDLIAGARPNFIKICPLIDEIVRQKKIGKDISFRLIHTGQHFDKNMSQSFFEELSIPHPNYNLNAGGGTQSEQAAKIMMGYEKLLYNADLDFCIVVGDVTSTMACSIVAKKMMKKVVHIEGGIRSFDMSMPEEINRIVTDSITDYFFTTSETANQNLEKIGVDKKNIFFVGNTMIDTLTRFKSKFTMPDIWKKLQLKEKEFVILTLHRPSNVDDPYNLKKILTEICNNAKDLPIIFPAHPRAIKKISSLSLSFKNLHIVEPLGYLNFNYLVERSLGVITDSGGITEETTVMNVPCITIRDNTERPETVNIGTNVLVGSNPKNISLTLKKLLNGEWKKSSIPPLWDGKTSSRIIKKLFEIV
tara:strand:+ start:15417 stop:16505 length:1089 start_codon:yes stop_codon:yes gene_type:complete